MIRRVTAFCSILCLAVTAIAAQPTALVGPTAVTPADSAVVEDATIVIEDGHIASVGPSTDVSVPEDAVVHEMPDAYVLPGFIDGHVHFFQSGGLYTRPDILDLRAKRPYSEELKLLKQRLPDTFRRYLRSGITSVVDAGGPMWNLDVRARAETTATAPAVVTAGPLISSVSRRSLDEGDPPILKITTPDAAREEVQEQVEAGVDLIKIWYIVGGDETPADYRPVVEATVDEAHRAGKRVAVHATELQTARAAVEAGADILVHSVFDRPVNDAFVQLLKKEEVLYTPTLMVRERYNETFAQQLDFTRSEHRIGQKEVIGSLFDLRTLPDSLVPRGLRQRIERGPAVPSDTVALRNLKRLHDAGVSIVAGTDAGNIGTPHGPALYREFELMRAAGLTPREILTAATVGGARLMGMEDSIGRIEAGYQADLVVVEENPLQALPTTSSIRRVMNDGRVFEPEMLVSRSPEEVVLQGRNALNAHDTTAFLDVFADDFQVFDHPSALSIDGRASFAERYRPLLDRGSQVHAQFHYHTTVGSTVVAHETMNGLPDRETPLTQVVLYRVNDGVIDRAWLVQEAPSAQ